MATPFPFVAGAVLTAANLNAITELVTNTQTNDYTLAATDAGDRVIANKASAIVFTVPNSVFSASQIVRIHNIGAGTLTLSAAAGLTLNGADVLTVAQYQGGELFFTSASSAIFFPTAKTVADSGLTLVTSSTIGTTVSTHTVSSAFSATFDNYLIIASGGSATTNIGLNLTFGATTTGYSYAADFVTYTGSSGVFSGNNTTSFSEFAQSSANGHSACITVLQPFASAKTFVSGISSTGLAGASGLRSVAAGFVNNDTSYTAFTFTTTTGTITGGTVKVYGYKN